MRPFLLDTSSIRAASEASLKALADRGALFASPFSCWELMTHLDDSDFELARRTVLKLRSFQLRDDPYAEWDRALGEDLSRRMPDQVLIQHLLDRLALCSSLEDFESANIPMPDGTVRQVGGCIARTRAALDEGAKRFQKLLVDSGQYVRDKYRASDIDSRMTVALSLARGDWVKHPDYRGESATPPEVIEPRILFWSYVAEKALETRGYTEQLARNDFEDGAIVLHVSAADSVTVVTEDKKFRSCLERALETVRAFDEFSNSVVRISDLSGISA